jgi:hypothetical protein
MFTTTTPRLVMTGCMLACMYPCSDTERRSGFEPVSRQAVRSLQLLRHLSPRALRRRACRGSHFYSFHNARLARACLGKPVVCVVPSLSGQMAVSRNELVWTGGRGGGSTRWCRRSHHQRARPCEEHADPFRVRQVRLGRVFFCLSRACLGK